VPADDAGTWNSRTMWSVRESPTRGEAGVIRVGLGTLLAEGRGCADTLELGVGDGGAPRLRQPPPTTLRPREITAIQRAARLHASREEGHGREVGDGTAATG
jgi:hypothetical protein